MKKLTLLLKRNLSSAGIQLWRNRLLFFHALAVFSGAVAALLLTPQSDHGPNETSPTLDASPVGAAEIDLLEIARSAQLANFASTLKELLPSKHPEQATVALKATRLLCRRWIERDPDQVLAFLAQNPKDYETRGQLLSEWLILDAAGVFAALSRTGPPEIPDYFVVSAMHLFSRSDPEGFLEIQDSIDADPEDLKSYRASAVETLAWRTPEKAILWLDQVESDFRLQPITEIAAGKWAQTDPEAAVAWVETLDSPATRQGALRAIVFEVAKTDLDVAHQLIQKTGVGGDYHGGIYGEIAHDLTRSDSVRAIEWISQYGPEAHRTEAATALIRRTTHPKLSIAMLDALPPGPARSAAALERFTRWGAGDPEIALDWIRGKFQGPERTAALKRFAQSIGESNFDIAWQFANQLKDSPDDETVRHHVIAGLAKYQFERAREIALDSGDTDFYHEVIAAAVQKQMWDVAEPAEFAALISELPADYDEFGRYLPYRHLMSAWVERDLEAAVSWVQNLPPGSRAREESLGGLASYWTFEDPGAARDWVAALPAGPERDTAFERIAEAMGRKDGPAGAFSAALEIGDDLARDKALSETVESWRKRDPEAAWNGIETSNLDTAEKERLFRTFHPE